MKLTYLHWYKREEPLWVDDAGGASRRPTVFANLAGSGIGGGEARIRADFENGDHLREIFRSMDLAKPQWGSSELREAIGATYGVPPTNVLTTTGASVAISIVFLAIREMFGTCDVLVESPSYGPLFEIPETMGFRVRHFERRLEDGFAIRSELIGTAASHARVIVLTNLNNPTGAAVPAKDIAALLNRVPRDAIMIVDETFARFAPEIGSVASFREPRLISINTLSKTCASVLRCGWIIAHGEILDAIRRSWTLYFNSPCSLTEAAAARIFRSPETYEPSRQRLAENRRIVKASFDALAADGLLGWTPPAYGCIAFPRITRAAQAADPAAWMEQFYGRLRDESRVSIVPSKWFLAPSHARVGFGGETHVVREGIARLEAAIRNTP